MSDRPSPDALLAEAAREKRGQLKVFLGAAPGVGKTFAMLEAGQRARTAGIDVVAGVIETHGRAETAALLKGIELLAPQRLEHGGKSFEEFDLDALLTRRPRLALIDELAHSNIDGARHPKRWQDVEEILAAGIDVYTTLNVQHLESLNDVVAQITRIRVRETLPDRILAEADEIELIDLPPSELIQRLKEGRVYVPERAQRAIRHFFAPGNLTALRELALRKAAERVDAQMLGYMQSHGIAGPWPTAERILVHLEEGELGARTLRTAARIANRLKAPWVAVHVETAASERWGDERRDGLARLMLLAERLGAETLTLRDEAPAQALLRLARTRNISQIIIGATPKRWGRRSLADRLLAQTDGIGIQIVSGKSTAPRDRPALLRPTEWRKTPLALGIVAATTAVVYGFGDHIPTASIPLLLLAGVLVASVTTSLGAAVLAALTAVVGYNLFFLAPLYTLSIANPENVATLLVFLSVAVLTANLAARVRRQADAAKLRERRTAALYDFSKKIVGAAEADDVLWAVVHHVAATLGAQSAVLMPDEDGILAIRAAYPPEDHLDERAQAAADWTAAKGEPTGQGTETLPTSDWLFVPLRTGVRALGVLGVRFPKTDVVLAPDQRRLIDAVAGQAALAVERTKLVDDIEDARLAAETEKLRSALLSSLSHDLRTPLAAILGSASGLIDMDSDLSPAARRDLLGTIRSEAERLNRFVGNLLDMTRIAAGALHPKRDWCDPADLAASALSRVATIAGERRIDLDLPPSPPLIQVDGGLIEQALVNLLENALKYAPADRPIRLGLAMDDAWLTYTVSDEGPGIPANALELVFDPFFRVRSEDRQTAGTGLGLAISKAILLAHGGDVRAQSPITDDPAHPGTRLTLRLPLAISLP
ncbi:DUF4118 domain-containing protein [Lacibacterium aquatile]|uniref:histidine kinase n=1 Tax=Lacibacterium aquatile TaxID=1168082 RepID=A0ABW5DUD2_9PROT